MTVDEGGPALLIRAGFEIAIRCDTETSLLCALSPRPEVRPVLGDGAVRTDSRLPVQTYVDSFGNRLTRLENPGDLVTLTSDFVVEDSGEPDDVHPWAQRVPIGHLPAETLRFLLPSRFVESDLLSGDAWARFGQIEEGWAQVQAVCDFVHNHIEFGYVHGRPTKTALDAYREGQGVCRDFAHLAIAFYRALNIPARYCSGYIGDIGVPYAGPMDFCAWFEVYLGGRWYTFDARYNTPRIGRILMVRGMDAADVSMIMSYGAHRMEKFEVWCDEIAAGRTLDDLKGEMRVPVVGIAAA
jgi:transglutaminase-like putative cysteine protease